MERIVNLIHKTATGKKSVRIALTPLLGGVFFLMVLLVIFSSFYMDRFFGFRRFVSRPVGLAVSIPFLTAGTLLWAWCAVKFLKKKGTPVPVNPPPTLITDGPYAWSRNPMMTGLFMLVAGIGILCGSVSLVFIMTALFVLIAALEFKFIEEPELEKRFGQAYLEYKKKTPMIIPRIRRRG